MVAKRRRGTIPVKLGPYYRAKMRRKRAGQATAAAALMAIAAVSGGLFGATRGRAPFGSVQPGEVVTGCSVTDSDTIRCGEERNRLLGIDAPELPGHCREGRVCASGDPYASTQSLASALTDELKITRVGTDRYGRTLAMVAGADGDLSCWQLKGAAIKPISPCDRAASP